MCEMTYSLLEGECAVFNWGNGERLDRKGILNELNKKEEQLGGIYCWIDDKIDELEDRYEFGKKNGFCEMHNIRFAINVLKELQNEIMGDDGDE